MRTSHSLQINVIKSASETIYTFGQHGSTICIRPRPWLLDLLLRRTNITHLCEVDITVLPFDESIYGMGIGTHRR